MQIFFLTTQKKLITLSKSFFAFHLHYNWVIEELSERLFWHCNCILQEIYRLYIYIGSLCEEAISTRFYPATALQQKYRKYLSLSLCHPHTRTRMQESDWNRYCMFQVDSVKDEIYVCRSGGKEGAAIWSQSHASWEFFSRTFWKKSLWGFKSRRGSMNWSNFFLIIFSLS